MASSENPKSLSGNTLGLTVAGISIAAVDHDGGRPPDIIPQVQSSPTLERFSSPLALEDQRFSKQGRSIDRNMIGLDGNVSMDFDSEVQRPEAVNQSELSDQVHGGQEASPKISYARMVAGDTVSKSSLDDIADLTPDKVIVRDEDCVIDHSGKYPTIAFSNHVHEQIDQCRRQTIIVHPRDYEKALTAGPWTIYGSYLTVQPWSRSFSPLEKHPSHVVVWVRLPGLPYRYYSKALFRRIAGVIGKVIKVDYSTQAGERGRFARLAVMVDLNKPLLPCLGIDGQVQKLEYEGLQHICYKCGVYGHGQEVCPRNEKVKDKAAQTTSSVEDLVIKSKNAEGGNDLYGPWMMVDNRRRRPANVGRDVRDKLLEVAGVNGSRFSVLNVDDIEYVQDALTERNPSASAQAMDTIDPNSSLSPAATIIKSTEVIKSTASHASNSTKKSQLHKDSARQVTAIPMVPGSSIKVVEHESLGKFSEHRAVSILEQGQELNAREEVHNVLTEWVENVNAQLDTIVHQKELEPGGSSKVIVNNGGSLEVILDDYRHRTPGGLATNQIVMLEGSNVPMPHKDWRSSCVCTSRKNNRVVDALATKVNIIDLRLLELEDPPDFVLPLLQEDQVSIDTHVTSTDTHCTRKAVTAGKCLQRLQTTLNGHQRLQTQLGP
ncbi:hypothetical protein GQ457_15G005980 [Hibiscus cannabinus]